MGVVIAGVGLGESRFWVATDGGDWHESANWSASSGGEGGATVPGSGDVAVFDDNSGDCVLNDDVEVGGLHLTAGFQGRVSQGSAVLAIGDGRFDVAGGEFSGGSENITIDMGATTGGAPLALLGGVFTSSSGRLSILRSSTESEVMVHFSGGTFNHNSGELYIFCNPDVKQRL